MAGPCECCLSVLAMSSEGRYVYPAVAYDYSGPHPPLRAPVPRSAVPLNSTHTQSPAYSPHPPSTAHAAPPGYAPPSGSSTHHPTYYSPPAPAPYPYNWTSDVHWSQQQQQQQQQQVGPPPPPDTRPAADYTAAPTDHRAATGYNPPARHVPHYHPPPPPPPPQQQQQQRPPPTPVSSAPTPIPISSSSAIAGATTIRPRDSPPPQHPLPPQPPPPALTSPPISPGMPSGLDFFKVCSVLNTQLQTHPSQLLDSYKMILDSGDGIKNGAKPSLDLLDKMLQCATHASQMLQQAAGVATTASNYSSLSGANALPATANNNNTREDTKEGIVNPNTNASPDSAASTSTSVPNSPPVNTTSSSAPPAKKQVSTMSVRSLARSLSLRFTFCSLVRSRKRNKAAHRKLRTKVRHVWGVM